MTKRGPWNVIVRGVCCLFLGSTGAALIGNVMQKTAKIRSGRGSLTNFSKKITGLQQHYLCRIRYLQERTPKKNRRPACGGQPADAYRRMLAPAKASLCKCLAKSAGASLYAYRANAYRYALSVHRRCKTSYTPPSTRRATCTRTQHPRFLVLKTPNTNTRARERFGRAARSRTSRRLNRQARNRQSHRSLPRPLIVRAVRLGFSFQSLRRTETLPRRPHSCPAHLHAPSTGESGSGNDAANLPSLGLQPSPPSHGRLRLIGQECIAVSG